MKNNRIGRFGLVLMLTGFLILVVNLQLAKAQTEPEPNVPALPQSQDEKAKVPAVDSDENLRRAIQAAGGSEELIIVNLEDYLKRYPQSARRLEIEEEIYKLAIKIRDRDRTITYAEKQLERNPAGIELLTTIVSTLRARKATGDMTRALDYAERLVKQFESLIQSSRKPGRLSAAQWQEQKDQGRASVYLVRGRVLAAIGQLEKAKSDLRKSFELMPLADAALALSEVAENQQRRDDALNYALQAFVITLAGDAEGGEVKELRQRLSSLYSGKNNNENGLGDLVLQAYDKYTRERDERLARLEGPSSNSGLDDVLKFKLPRPDGSILDLAALRGKVVVMNFWATWCGPCRTELPLFQKAIEKYQSDSDVAFLAVSTDADREFVEPYLRQNKHKLPVVFAENIDGFFNVSAIPTTIILDRRGKVSYRMRGFNPNEDFTAQLSGWIEAAKKK